MASLSYERIETTSIHKQDVLSIFTLIRNTAFVTLNLGSRKKAKYWKNIINTKAINAIHKILRDNNAH